MFRDLTIMIVQDNIEVLKMSLLSRYFEKGSFGNSRAERIRGLCDFGFWILDFLNMKAVITA